MFKVIFNIGSSSLLAKSQPMQRIFHEKNWPTAKWEKLDTVFKKLDITSEGLQDHFLVMPTRV